jgi:hypothetical protein
MDRARPQGVRIAGILVFDTFAALPSAKYEVEVAPRGFWAHLAYLMKTPNISPVDRDSGKFEFSAADKVSPGKYDFVLSEAGKIITSKPVTLEDDNKIILAKDGGADFSAIRTDFVDYFKQRYKEGDWQDQLIAIDQLARLSKENGDTMRTFEAMLSSSDPGNKEMAAFVLGRACAGVAFDALEQIMATSENTYLKIRAAGYLMCPGSKQSDAARDLLYSVMQQDKDEIKQRVGAWVLFVYGKRAGDKCIFDRVLKLLDSPLPGVRDHVAYQLSRYIYRRFNVDAGAWDNVQWRTWWSAHSSEFTNCNSF